MPALDMTSKPLDLKINLTRNSDFIRAMEPIGDTTFPVGAAIILDFGSVEWPATMTPELASWHVDKAEVDALIAMWDDGKQTLRPCKLRYEDGENEIVWAVSRQVLISG